MATILFVALLIWLAVNSNAIVSFMNAYHKRNAAKEALEDLKSDVLDLEEKELKLKLGSFQNEKSVREDYHLVKPGEKLILVRPKETKEGEKGPQIPEKPPEKR